jgi:hypothetical protein
MNTSLESADIKSPVTWKYVLGAVITFPFLLLLWVVLDLRFLRPELVNFDVEATMDFLRRFGVPLLAVVVLFGGKWIFDTHAADERKQAWIQRSRQLEKQMLAQAAEKAQREYMLEVLGLGVTVEKYRQGKLWKVLQDGGAYASIRDPDPKNYPWTRTDKIGQTGGRACDSLENGADRSPMFWGVPTMYAGGAIHNPKHQPSAVNPMSGLAASAVGTGMAWHLFVTGPWELEERPDKLLEQAFALFDTYPNLPYLVLLTTEDEIDRDEAQPPGMASRIQTGYYIPEYPDTSAVFVLARRERVEPLRPYVWEDPENDYLQENLRYMYFELGRNVPMRAELKAEFPHSERQPTIAEWLPAAAKFAKHPVFEHKDGSLLDTFKRWVNHPPKDWKPTPWFPLPWNRNQMEAFDRLPSLGFVHRPVFVKFEDEHGQPVKRRDARQKILEAGWQQALQTLPDAARSAGPARIIAAFDKNTEQRIALESLLHGYAAQGGPAIDSGKTSQFIDTERRMGNTGAATFFVQMAVGVMGSYIEGGPSAAINLRDPAGASIVFISPPAEEKRNKQGLNVFKHMVQPSIDPENYKPPTVASVLGTEAQPEHDAVAD